MKLYFILMVISIMILFKRINQEKLGLKISFFILFIFSSLRFDFGNDYAGYYKWFETIKEIQNIAEVSKYSISLEYGYLILNWLFSWAHFNIMLTLIAYFTCCTYYRLIVKYVPKRYYWISLLFYLLEPALFFIQLSSIRQTIAICFFINAIPYLIERKIIKYSILLFIGTLFHKSIIVLLPFYFLYTNKKIKKSLYYFITLGVYSSLYYRTQILLVVVLVLKKFFPKYLIHIETIKIFEVSSGIGVLLNFIITIMILETINRMPKDKIIFSKILISNYFIYVIALYVPLVSRIALYMIPSALVFYPLFIDLIKNKVLKYVILSLIILINIVLFIKFFNNDMWAEKYNSYKTVLEQSSY